MASFTLPPTLISAVQEQRAILFLGAGTAIGAEHPKKTPIPLGLDLRDMICDKYFGGQLKNRPLTAVAATVAKNPGIVSLTILSCITFIGAPVQSAQLERPINSVREIRASLRACWISPAVTKVPQLTVRLSLKRNGEILGQPLITYQTPGASEDERAALHAAVAAALARCTPLPISDELGGILAGHPINVKLGEGWKRRGAPTASPGR